MQDPKIAKKSPSGHYRTTLSGYIFATKARIDNRKKNLLSSNISSTCPHNMVNFGPLAAGSLGHPCKFQRVSRLGSVTARHYSRGHQPNFAALNRGRHPYSAGRPSRWALAHISSYVKQWLVKTGCRAHYCHDWQTDWLTDRRFISAPHTRTSLISLTVSVIHSSTNDVITAETRAEDDTELRPLPTSVNDTRISSLLLPRKLPAQHHFDHSAGPIISAISPVLVVRVYRGGGA